MSRGRGWRRHLGHSEVMLLAFALAAASGIPWAVAAWLA
jgi:hypothetical protein